MANNVAQTIKSTLAIPFYAYGDNQAACEAFDALQKASTEIERLSREVERMKAGITAIYHHNEACRAGVTEHFRAWWPLSSGKGAHLKYRCAGCGADDRTHPKFCEWCGSTGWEEVPEPGDEEADESETSGNAGVEK